MSGYFMSTAHRSSTVHIHTHKQQVDDQRPEQNNTYAHGSV